MKTWERLLCTVSACLTILPGIATGVAGLALCAPVFIRQIARSKLQSPEKVPVAINPSR